MSGHAPGGRHLLIADDALDEMRRCRTYLTVCGLLLPTEELPSWECPPSCQRPDCSLYCEACVTLTHLLQPDAAFMAVRRAVELAQGADDPLLAAALKGSVSWQLMVSGRFMVAVRTAGRIEPHGDAPAQHLSVYGSLLVTAATAAARDNRKATAGDFLGSAAEVAHRVGADRTDYETPFGPSQVTMQTVDVGVVTLLECRLLTSPSPVPDHNVAAAELLVQLRPPVAGPSGSDPRR